MKKLVFLPFLFFLAVQLGCTPQAGYDIESDSVRYFHGEELFSSSHIDMPDADSMTFTVLEQDKRYGLDKSGVYFLGKRIKDADPNKFRLLVFPYSADEAFVFCATARVGGADSGSFVVLRGARGVVSTYENGQGTEGMYGEIQTVDENGAYVGSGWAKDSTGIYYGPVRLENADKQTFEVIDERYARDKNGMFKHAFRMKN